MNPYQKIARIKTQRKYDMIFGVREYLQIVEKQKKKIELSFSEELFLKEIYTK
jgi:hypothetical protein